MKLDLLFEAINYDQMFANMDIVQKELEKIAHGDLIKKEIVWAKQNLKRNDRIVWWLRYYKLWLIEAMVNEAEQTPQDISKETGKLLYDLLAFETKRYNSKTKGLHYVPNSINQRYLTMNVSRFIHEIKRNRHEDMVHFLSLDIPKIQNKIFSWELYPEISQEFQDHETEFNEKKKSILSIEPNDKLFLDVGDGFAWYDLDKAYCEREAGAMGHCGNSPMKGMDKSHTLLSLRKKTDDNMVRPSLTFILDKRNGMIGEMKGRNNNKPDKKYHKYIVPLLLDKRIEGIEGGGYKPENNFSVKDLPRDEMEDLLEKKPELMDDETNIEINGFNNQRAVDYMEREHNVEVVMGTGRHATLRFHEFTDFSKYVQYTHQKDSLVQALAIVEGNDEYESSLDENDLSAYLTDEHIKLFAKAFENKEQAIFDFVNLNDAHAVVSLLETHYPELIKEMVKALQDSNKELVIGSLKSILEQGIGEIDEDSESSLYIEFEDNNDVLNSRMYLSVDEYMFNEMGGYGEDWNTTNVVHYFKESGYPEIKELDIPNEMYKEIDEEGFDLAIKQLVKEYIK